MAETSDLIPDGYRPVVIRPGDKIIFEAEGQVSSEVASLVQEKLREAFPDHEVFVVTGGRIIVESVN